jgi:hypothetical protein
MGNVDRSIELWSSDDSGGKLIWSARASNATFYFYIPKWRVPEPWPGLINVHITDDLTPWKGYDPLAPSTAQEDPGLLENPIFAKVRYSSTHTETFRYDPFGTQEEEIGSPYIPMSLLPTDPPEILLVKVRWVISTKGKFRVTRVHRTARRPSGGFFS